MSSEFSAKFDDMADWMVDASFFAALGYRTNQAMNQPFWFWLGCAAAAGRLSITLSTCFITLKMNRMKMQNKRRSGYGRKKTV